MTKKRSPHKNSHKNHSTNPHHESHPVLSNHLNRIINTQDRMNEANLNIDLFLNIAANQVHNMTGASGTVIELVKGDDLLHQVALGCMEKFAGLRTDKNNGISGLCISTHQIIRAEDAENDSRIDIKECLQMKARSLIVTPFFYGNHASGVIKVISDRLNAFTDIDIQTIHVIAGLIGSAMTQHHLHEASQTSLQEKERALENLRKMEKKTKHMAHHDYLTGLPNRNLFNDQLTLTLAKAKRKKQLIALMYLDVDHFKNVNETYGHALGDTLLQAIAHRLKQCLRASDLAARFGGDEFVVLIDDIKEVQDAIVISNKILQAMRQPFNLGDKPLSITMSIGISFLRDVDITADDFIRQSDQALFISKNSGRNTFYIFDNELTVEQSFKV
jgi:diguanylate cyclase (GGDEF)-like protein